MTTPVFSYICPDCRRPATAHLARNPGPRPGWIRTHPPPPEPVIPAALPGPTEVLGTSDTWFIQSGCACPTPTLRSQSWLLERAGGGP